jgi:hypothetical protein
LSALPLALPPSASVSDEATEAACAFCTGAEFSHTPARFRVSLRDPDEAERDGPPMKLAESELVGVEPEEQVV